MNSRGKSPARFDFNIVQEGCGVQRQFNKAFFSCHSEPLRRRISTDTPVSGTCKRQGAQTREILRCADSTQDDARKKAACKGRRMPVERDAHDASACAFSDHTLAIDAFSRLNEGTSTALMRVW